jgi:hypothetical protein
MATGIGATVGSLQESISGMCAIPAADDFALLASAEPIGELCMRSSKLKLTGVD